MNRREALNILVLGVGGIVSQGILKALAISGLKCRIIGACIHLESLGLYTTDRSYISPPASDPRFVDWVFNICQEERIDLVMSGVEAILEALSPHREALRRQTGALCIVSEPETLALGADKLRTARWLEAAGFNFARSAAADEDGAVAELARSRGYPLIAKPRNGHGSRGILVVRTAADLERACRLPGYVIQEYLGNDDAEFTAGCFSDRNGDVRGVIVMRRQLVYGTTVRAEVGEFPEARAEAERIAAALKPMGPCNVQMRMDRGRAVCFEINVRFSGTTAMRARLGFNDVEAAARHYALEEPPKDLPVVTSGAAIRYWNEAYLSPQVLSDLKNHGRLDSPRHYGFQIEPYAGQP